MRQVYVYLTITIVNKALSLLMYVTRGAIIETVVGGFSSLADSPESHNGRETGFTV